MTPPSQNTDSQTPSLSAEALQAKIYQLQRLQAELEIQNKQLRQSEDEHLAAQSRYFDLYDQAPVGYCTLSEKDLILEANHTASNLVGAPWGGLTQWPISRFILPEDQDLYSSLRKNLVEKAEPQECELRMVRVDGSGFWAHLKATAIQTKAGEPACHIVLIDISDRKRAEKLLEENEEKYRLFFNSAGDAIYIHDENGRILEANTAANEYLGYSPSELLSMVATQVDAPKEAAFTQKRIRQLEEHGILEFESAHQRKDGSIFPVEVKAKLILWNGQPAVISICRDITERKQTEETLRLFKALVENSSDAIGMSTPEGKHYYQNEAFTRLFGEIGECPPKTLYADPVIGAEVFRKIQTGENWRGELKMFKADQSLLDIHLRAYAIKADDGHIIGVVGLHTDFTAQRQAERGQA